MNGLTSADLLDLADRGGALNGIERGLLLLAYAWPESAPEDRLLLPIGVRNRLALALRIRTFGPAMEARAQCRHCSAELSAGLDLAAMLADHVEEPPSVVTIELDGETLEFRLPSSQDLAAASRQPQADAGWELFRLCLASPAPAVNRAVNSEAARRQAAAAISAADPLADIEFELTCERCAQTFAAPFDAVGCFWTEIEAGAARIASEVHRIASAYGWSEDRILALNPARRRRYLELIAP